MEEVISKHLGLGRIAPFTATTMHRTERMREPLVLNMGYWLLQRKAL
jgi:hypothetical protein